MAQIKIATAYNIDLEFTTAEIHYRLFAWMIDILVQIIGVYLISFLFKKIFSYSVIESWLFTFFVWLPLLFYHLASELIFNGQSVGKMIFKLKVISLSGDKPSLGQYSLRWCFRLIDIAISFGLVACISIATGKRNQRLGDLVAGTVVIMLRNNVSTNDFIYIPVDYENHTLLFPEVMRLTDRDINSIKNLIDVNKKHYDTLILAQYAERVKSVLAIESTLEPLTFFQQLLEDYNYLATK